MEGRVGTPMRLYQLIQTGEEASEEALLEKNLSLSIYFYPHPLE